MTPDVLRVYVNAAPLDLPVGATALDAVRAANAGFASDVEAGTRLITDSRGLPISPGTAAHGGAIYRVVANRGTVTSETDDF